MQTLTLLPASLASLWVFGGMGWLGVPLGADTAAVTFGFGVLVLSQVPANAALGLLVALALVASCGLTLVGLGAGLGKAAAGTGAGDSVAPAQYP